MSAPRRVSPEPARRGWCPSLARPMPTGDGLLARVHPPLGILTPAQARAVAEGARSHGNGHIDVTARANLQVRGVTEATRCGLAEALGAAGLGDVRGDGGPQRLTLTAPLAGLEATPIDIPSLAGSIEAIGLAIPGLPPKALVAVEAAESGACLGGAQPDCHLVATAEGMALHLAGDAAWWHVPADDVPTVLDTALRRLAESGQRRVRDLSSADRGGLVLGLRPATTPAGASLPRPGLLPLNSRLLNARGQHGSTLLKEEPSPASRPRENTPIAILVDAPFGRCTADALESLADAAESLGGKPLRLSPTRGFLLVTPDAAAAEAVRTILAAAGFLTEADDSRRAVAACPGAPACASGSTATLIDAARLADAFEAFAARGLSAHVSGCAKGCAHPAAASLTLVGRDGLYGIVLDGRPDALSATLLTFDAALERVRRADPAYPDTLAHAFRTSP
ncbi:precorrin-3B synthase [Methylobacterium sp. 10]|uniref:precorrin-3B synthase n=1 Tax=Methylobacterium sp. 10 TaxID=1101191 RepID=UPI0004BB94EB|nr:precorrin-3B synthase [Methylobacterium sp. 10]